MANLKFGGEEEFAAPPHELFRRLTDLDALAASIPDLVTSSQRIDERTLEAVVRPGFSFLRGTLKMRITFPELEPTTKAKMLISAQGIGVTMGVVSLMQLRSSAVRHQAHVGSGSDGAQGARLHAQRRPDQSRGGTSDSPRLGTTA
jgi:carbon monoxide dehydrogenase subunit G